MSRRELTDGISHISAESHGLMTVSIVTPQIGLDLLAAALLGNSDAAGLLRAVSASLARIKRAPQRRPVLCVACPRPVRRVTAATVFGVACPAVDNPANALAFVFCDKCGGEQPAALLAKAQAGLKKIWPDMRPIEVHPTARGHA